MLAASLLVASSGVRAIGGEQTGVLKIIVLEGEDAVNLIDKKTAVKPTVEVRDRNDLPVAGALVRFAIRGRGAAFNNGVRQLTVTTDTLGRATVTELTPVGKGALEIQVNASYQGQTAAATIHQTNFASAADAASAGRTPPESQSAAQSATATSTTTAGAGTGGGLSGLATAGIVAGAAAATATTVVVARNNRGPAITGIVGSPATGLQSSTPIAFSAAANDESGDPLSYAWEFGDGGTSTEVAPAHVYNAAGTFTVRLTVSDSRSSAERETTVTVKSLSGTWTGQDTQFNYAESFALTQSGATVTGTLSALPADAGCCGSVSGAVSTGSPRVSLTVVINGRNVTFTFSGEPGLDGNTLIGFYNGAGYVNLPIALTRR